jgi:cysteine desulfurase / selenocysteine lyase
VAIRGGGTIEVVTTGEVYWAEAPEKYEAGSPNLLGAVAMGAGIRILKSTGMDLITDHEKELTSYALSRLNQLPGIRIYGSADPTRLEDRVGVIPFEVIGVPHGKVAAILSFEGGIGVRNGCFCAHPYVINLLKVSEEEFNKYKKLALNHDRRQQPGLVRASFGCYNSLEEVDILVEMLERIIAGDYKGDYIQDITSGSFFPDRYEPGLIENYFSL